MSFWHLRPAEPQQPALIDGDTVLSYQALAVRADGAFAAFGPRSGKRLGAILCRNALPAIAAYLGALRGGDAVMLLNENTAPELHAPVLDAYRPDWIVRPEGGVALPGYRQLQAADGWEHLARTEPATGALHPELAVLLSTSGTTGSPRYVRLSYHNLASNAQAIAAYLGMDARARAITTLPFSYSYGMSVINSHLAAGASVVLTEHSLMQREFWDCFRSRQVTSLAGVPYTYQMLQRLDLRKLELDSLHTLTQAGGHLPERLAEYFGAMAQAEGWRFFVMYGQTEASPRISYVPPEMLGEKRGSIGVAIPGGRLSLTGEGELVYEGDNVMMGYAGGRDDLDHGDELGGRLHTGDLARIDADGYVFLQGRARRIIKIHGNRISLDDVEQRLEAALHQQVAAVGADDKLQVFLAAGADTEAARAVLQAAYRLHPTTFQLRQMEQIPLQASGKKDYCSLPR